MTRANAILIGKGSTEGRCVFTTLTGVDAAHFYPAGDYPALADLPENIFSMVRHLHSVIGKPCFDFLQRDGVDIVRPVSQRRWMLENMTHEDFRRAIKVKIMVVGGVCEAHDIEFPDAEKPEDYVALIYQSRLS